MIGAIVVLVVPPGPETPTVAVAVATVIPEGVLVDALVVVTDFVFPVTTGLFASQDGKENAGKENPKADATVFAENDDSGTAALWCWL
tara:strand:- start:48 stop:311 length:264 start_codon:yes stop_codon:yes gene_type:complete